MYLHVFMQSPAFYSLKHNQFTYNYAFNIVDLGMEKCN